MEGKKILSMFLSCALFFSGNSGQVFAQKGMEETPKEEPKVQIYESRIEEGNGPYYELDMEVEEVSLPREERVRQGEIPASYDSRDYHLIPEVKNQGQFGACWTFASMVSAEAGLISQGELLEEKVADTSLDLSEYQLARFQYFGVDDPLHNITGDRTSLLVNGAEITGQEEVTSPDSYLNIGGNVFLAMWSMATWQSGAKEETAPYTSIESTGGILSEDVAFENIAQLENAYILSMKQPEIVKNMIRQYGAVATSYKSGDESYEITTDENGVVSTRYFSGNRSVDGVNASQYFGHAIALVGWDDDYPVENFPEDCRPKSPGAWLVRNSWGSSWGEEGYFWMPYEEATLSGEALALDYTSAGKYDYNYQYDGSSNNYSFAYNSDMNYANIFQVKGEKEQILDAVGIGVNSSNVDYELQIYIDPEVGKPDTGTPLFQTPQKGTLLYPGYHTVSLEQVVTLKPGQSFSVVFKVKSGVSIFYDTTQDSGVFRFVNQTQPNQSMCFIGTYQCDFHEGYKVGLLAGSLRIKAYTVDAGKKEEVITKASPGKDGKIEQKYRGLTFSKEAISAPATVELSQEEIPFDGLVHEPQVIAVRDQDGNLIDTSHYTVEVETKDSKNPGTYHLMVHFQGEYYTGSMKKEYQILQPEIATYQPQGLTMQGNGKNQITLSWNPYEKGDGYRIYHAESLTGIYEQIAEISDVTQTSYQVEQLEEAKSYYFKLVCYQDFSGEVYESISSETLKANTLEHTQITKAEPGKTGKQSKVLDGMEIASTPISAPVKIQLSQTEFVANGSIQKPEVTGVYDEEDHKIPEEFYQISYDNEKSSEIGNYKITVDFQGDFYEGSLETTYELVEHEIVLKTPHGVIQSQNGEDTITISWEEEPLADAYQVYQSDTEDGEYQLLSTVEGSKNTVYPVENLEKGRSYYFKIRYYVLHGTKEYESLFSEVLKGNTKTIQKITKATPEGNGKVEEILDEAVISSVEIYAPAELRLSTTEFTANGRIQKPEVTGVYDTKGEAISTTDYQVFWENENSREPGTYQIIVELKGECYQGTLNSTYRILPYEVSSDPESSSNTQEFIESQKPGSPQGEEEYKGSHVYQGGLNSKNPTDSQGQSGYQQMLEISNAQKDLYQQIPSEKEETLPSIKPGASFENGIYQFKMKNGKEAIFTGVSKSIPRIKIANTVTYQGRTLRVTSVAAKALKNDNVVTRVDVGIYVTSIGTSAFEGCSNLKTISMGKQIITIGQKALKNCKKLKKVTLPKTVTTIRKSAFEGCSKLNNITIQSKKLKVVQKKVFQGISPKAKIKVPKKSLKAYKKLLKNKGQSNKATIVSGK